MSKKQKQQNVVTLSRGTPHKSAEKFREQHTPKERKLKGFDFGTLLNIEQEWYCYDGSAYRVIKDKDIDAEVSRFMIAAKQIIMQEDTEGGSRRQAFAPFNPKRAEIAEVYAALERLCHHAEVEAPCWLTDDTGEPRPNARDLIACENGLLDFTTGVLHPKSADFFTLYAVPINYDAAAPKPERFLKFLGEVTMNRKSLSLAILEMLGYYLTTDTEHEVVHYLLGESRGGKGTLIKIIKALVGQKNIAAPTIRSFAGEFWGWHLRDKTLAIITDMAVTDREAVKLAANHINIISGRDPIDLNRKFKDPITAVTLPTRVLIAGNDMPDFGEHAPALLNRLILILFDVSFKGKEDRGLARHMIADELPGIFNYALAGLKRLRCNGKFAEPAESLAKKDELARLANPVRHFLDETCIIEPGASVNQHRLYEEYRAWCERHGIKGVLPSGYFAQRLYAADRSIRPTKPREHGRQVRHFGGVNLRDGTDLPPFDYEATLQSYLDIGGLIGTAEDAISLTNAAALRARGAHSQAARGKSRDADGHFTRSDQS